MHTQRQNGKKKLRVVEVEGGTEDEKTIFYTALYHTQIHPNIFNDVNGEYSEIATGKTGKTVGTRYTTFSLWDTYRNYHQLMSLLYPREQLDMVKSMLEMYDENGWLPKWELNSTETFTMVGDPAAIVLADTYLRGLTDFDVDKAYEAMLKSATQIEENPLRPGLEEYLKKGYVSVDAGVPGPVSVTQEYNAADYAIALLAKELGKEEDHEVFKERSVSYRKLYNSDSQFLQPKHINGDWLEGFDPLAGANFTKNPGFIEGNAWQYLFMLSHDAEGLMQLMGGKVAYEKKLDAVFNEGQFDMANEPDFAYPYLYNFIPGSEHKAQKKVHELLKEYYKNSPDGLPGNDDTGTMSAWAVYSMMGFYPLVTAEPTYSITAPIFDKIKINLNTDFYLKENIVILKEEVSGKNKAGEIFIDNSPLNTFFIKHETLINSNELLFIQDLE